MRAIRPQPEHVAGSRWEKGEGIDDGAPVRAANGVGERGELPELGAARGEGGSGGGREALGRVTMDPERGGRGG